MSAESVDVDWERARKFWPRLLAILVLLFSAGSAHVDHQFLKFIVCAVAVYTAYQAKFQEERGWVWLTSLMAILFNPFPFLQLHLSAGTWIFVDWISIVIMVISIKRDIGSTNQTAPNTVQSANNKTTAARVNETDKSAANDAINLNNEAVDAVKENEFSKAIVKLEKALLTQPGYQLALDNLVTAYEMFGTRLSSLSPKEAAAKFYRALLLSPDSETSIENLDYLAKRLNDNLRDPRSSASFDDHCRLGRQLFQGGDHLAALSAYIQALKAKPDLRLDDEFYDTLKSTCKNPTTTIYLGISGSSSTVNGAPVLQRSGMVGSNRTT